MAAFDVAKKLRIYHILYRMNRAFTAIVAHCRTLEETGLIKANAARRYQGFTQELQAEINGELLQTLHTTELQEWRQFGKVRQEWEKGLRDPHDSFTQSKRGKAGVRNNEDR
jgi:hypothetical protein